MTKRRWVVLAAAAAILGALVTWRVVDPLADWRVPGVDFDSDEVSWLTGVPERRHSDLRPELLRAEMEALEEVVRSLGRVVDVGDPKAYVSHEWYRCDGDNGCYQEVLVGASRGLVVAIGGDRDEATASLTEGLSEQGWSVDWVLDTPTSAADEPDARVLAASRGLARLSIDFPSAGSEHRVDMSWSIAAQPRWTVLSPDSEDPPATTTTP